MPRCLLAVVLWKRLAPVHIQRLVAVAFIALMVSTGSLAPAADWPQWLGPQRDGILREENIVEKFPEAGLKELWRVPIGAGYSGPAVAAGKLYCLSREVRPETDFAEGSIPPGAASGLEHVLCVDAETGATLWDKTYPSHYKISYPSGPRTTPIVEGDRLYTLGAMGHLICWNAADGSEIWKHDLMADYHMAQPQAWGFSAHPFIAGDLLYCLVGNTGSGIVAFNKHTGDEVWKALTTEEVGYAPPVLMDTPKGQQLVVWLTDVVAGFDPATGTQHWSLPYPQEGQPQRPEVTIATPRAFGNRLLITSFYQGSLVLEFGPDSLEPVVAWDRRSANLMQSDEGLHTVMCTPYVQDAFIYGICGFGELRCLNAETGDRVWETFDATGGKKALFANAFLIPHKDRCFIWNDQGDLILAKLTPEGYSEISRQHLLDPSQNARGREVTWSHPAIADGRFFARNDKELIGVSLREKEVQ